MSLPTSARRLDIDAGQSETKIRIVQGDQHLDQARREGIVTSEPVIPQLAELVDRVIADRGPIGTVSIGTTGLDSVQAAEELRARLVGRGVAHVFIAHDSITSFLGALGDRRGAVIAAGTGIVTLAVGESEIARVDGWVTCSGTPVPATGSGEPRSRPSCAHTTGEATPAC